MTTRQFNSLSLKEKAQFIISEIEKMPDEDKKAYGIYNDFIFPGMVINFQAAAMTGEIIYADAEVMPQEYKTEIDGVCGPFWRPFLINHDKHPIIKKHVFDACQRFNKRYN